MDQRFRDRTHGRRTLRGLPLDETLLRINRHDTGAAVTAAHELLTLPSPPTALFTLNNRLTVSALQALWTVGTPTALVGFDDFEQADLLPTPVTVIHHDPVELGRRGARLVFRRLSGDAGQPRTVQLPVKLIARGSGERPPS